MLAHAAARLSDDSDDADYQAYCIVGETAGAARWVRCGHARQNADGSLNLRLDAFPLTGVLHLRPHPGASARDGKSVLRATEADPEPPVPTLHS